MQVPCCFAGCPESCAAKCGRAKGGRAKGDPKLSFCFPHSITMAEIYCEIKAIEVSLHLDKPVADDIYALLYQNTQLKRAIALRKHFRELLTKESRATQQKHDSWLYGLERCTLLHSAHTFRRLAVESAPRKSYLRSQVVNYVATQQCCNTPMVKGVCQNMLCPKTNSECSLCGDQGLRCHLREGLCVECHAIKSCADDWLQLEVILRAGTGCFKCCKYISGTRIREGRRSYHRVCHRDEKKAAIRKAAIQKISI